MPNFGNITLNKTAAVASKPLEGTSLTSVTMNSSYGKFIKIVSKLGINCTEDGGVFAPPKIHVIGPQNSGKSSLLEAITKCNIFPRDSKFCTKLPIHFQLKNAGPGESEYVEIIFNDTKTTVQDINSREILENIEKIMKDQGDTISDNKVVIKIQKHDIAATFEYIDLPGIKEYPPEAEKKSKEIVQKYLAEPNSIFLCVIPSTSTCFTGIQAIGMILSAGRQKDSIICLTMCDRLADKDVDELLLSRLCEYKDDAQLSQFTGCVGVVNRKHQDNLTLAEAEANETEFFSKILKEVEDDSLRQQLSKHVTASQLLYRIDELFSDFIKTKWVPNTISNIRGMLSVKQRLLDKLGRTDVSKETIVSAYTEHVTKMVTSLAKDYKIHIPDSIGSNTSEDSSGYLALNDYHCKLEDLITKDVLKAISRKLLEISDSFFSSSDSDNYDHELNPERFEDLKKRICEVYINILDQHFKKALPQLKKILQRGYEYKERDHYSGLVESMNTVIIRRVILTTSVLETALKKETLDISESLYYCGIRGDFNTTIKGLLQNIDTLLSISSI